MSDDVRRRAEALFQEAADLPAEARGEFLDHACGADRPLRGTVERLLRAHEAMDNFLEPKPPDPVQ